MDKGSDGTGTEYFWWRKILELRYGQCYTYFHFWW